MKRIKAMALLSAAMLALMPVTTFAQKKGNTTSDYNLQKAYEVLQNDKDEDQALELLGKQLKDTPDNPDARLLRARIYRDKREFGNAISDLNHALKTNKPKKSEIPNSTLHWWKATVYMDMGDFVKAAESYKTALELARKDDKENVQNISFNYAQSLYNQKKYGEADAVYQQMLKEDETDQAAMVGLVRNMFERGQYQEMIPMLEDCMKYDTDYSEIYRFLAKAYDKLGETDKAIDACVNWFDKDSDADLEFITKVALKHKTYAVAKAQEKVKKSESPVSWRALLISIYEDSCEYELAIKEYDILESEFGKDPYINEPSTKRSAAFSIISRLIVEKVSWRDLISLDTFTILS